MTTAVTVMMRVSRTHAVELSAGIDNKRINKPLFSQMQKVSQEFSRARIVLGSSPKLCRCSERRPSSFEF